jgi:pimeloyl-ACP methyl ester carboxylesterase
MAQDVLELLDYLQWTKERSVNIVGISMGGMISLELAKAAPQRFCSMTLISTTSGRGNGEKKFSVSLPPVSVIHSLREIECIADMNDEQWTGVSTIGRLIAGRTLGFDSDEYRVNAVSELLFPPVYLDKKREGDPKGRYNRQIMQEVRTKILFAAFLSLIFPCRCLLSDIRSLEGRRSLGQWHKSERSLHIGSLPLN